MKISKNVEFDLKMDELAKTICDSWSDEQAQLLWGISNIVHEHELEASNQLYAVGKFIYESMTHDEQQRVKAFIEQLNYFIVEFEKK